MLAIAAEITVVVKRGLIAACEAEQQSSALSATSMPVAGNEFLYTDARKGGNYTGTKEGWPRIIMATFGPEGKLFVQIFSTLPPAGLEPAAIGLENRCSVQLSYGGKSLDFQGFVIFSSPLKKSPIDPLLRLYGVMKKLAYRLRRVGREHSDHTLGVRHHVRSPFYHLHGHRQTRQALPGLPAVRPCCRRLGKEKQS
jgi:hypothetical protein